MVVWTPRSPPCLGAVLVHTADVTLPRSRPGTQEASHTSPSPPPDAAWISTFFPREPDVALDYFYTQPRKPLHLIRVDIEDEIYFVSKCREGGVNETWPYYGRSWFFHE